MQRIYCILLTLTLLLTFVGQAVASVSMVCDMPHMNMATHASMQNNADVRMDDAAHNDMMKMDCCSDTGTTAQDCSCPISACSSHSALNAHTLFSASKLPSEKVNLALVQHQFHFAQSLYRPPMPA